MVFAIIFAVFDVLIWYDVLADDVSAAPSQENLVVSVPLNISHDASELVIQESVGVPVRIMIPSIAVDAVIEKVNLATDGSMAVPKDPLDAAWYALGPRPGERGSAVIAGHVNWINDQTGVFADLHKVQLGDTILVRDDLGVTVSFVVRERRRYDAAADAKDIFSSDDGKAHLNIITCDGVWDKSTQQYSERLVVFADRVD